MQKDLRITVKSALLGELSVLAILALAFWAFKLGLYHPSVIQRGQVSVSHGGSRVIARTQLLALGKGPSLWQVEVSPGDWRDCGHDCEKALRGALAE